MFLSWFLSVSGSMGEGGGGGGRHGVAGRVGWVGCLGPGIASDCSFIQLF